MTRLTITALPALALGTTMAAAVMRHLAEKPWQAARLTLARRAVTYLTRKPRAPVSPLPG